MPPLPEPLLRHRFAVAVVAELAYVAGRTVIRGQLESPIPRELAVTAWRLVSLAFLLFLYRDLFATAARVRAMPRSKWIWVAVAVELAIPVFAPKGQYDAAGMIVFSLATLVVAIREEFFYRAILQPGLARRLGEGGGIVATSFAFLLFHVGAQPMSLLMISLIVSAGILFGALYARTGNLLLVILLHLVVDLLWFLPAIHGARPVVALLAGFATCCIVLAWWPQEARERDRAAWWRET